MPVVEISDLPGPRIEYDDINYNKDVASSSAGQERIIIPDYPSSARLTKPPRSSDPGGGDRGRSFSNRGTEMSSHRPKKARSCSAGSAVNQDQQSTTSSGHHRNNHQKTNHRNPLSESDYSDDFNSEDERRSPPANRRKPPPANSRQHVQQKTKNAYKATMKKARTMTGSYGSTNSSGKEAGPDPTLRRMVSAKQHRISELENKLGELTIDLDRFFAENRSLRRIQQRQSRALEKYDGKSAELPQILKQNSDEVRMLRHQLRKKQRALEESERSYQDLNDQYNDTKDQLEHLRQLDSDKRLKEREQLTKELDETNNILAEKDKKYKDLERQLQLVQKNHKREINDIHYRNKDTHSEVDRLNKEINDLEEKIKEKDKEIGVRNIYSQRVMKPPARLSPKREPSPVRHQPKPPLEDPPTAPLEDPLSLKPPDEPPPAEEEPPPQKQVDEKPPVKPVPRKEKEDKNGPSQNIDDEDKMALLRAEKARRDRREAALEEERVRKHEQRKKEQQQEAERARKEREIEERERDEELRILADLDREREERLRQDEETEREKAEEEEREKARIAQIQRQKADDNQEASQRKVDLLQKLREIDDKHGSGSNFDGGGRRSPPPRKQYSFRKPDENLHDGKPSHDEVFVPPAGRRASKSHNKPDPSPPVSFGGYQPTLSDTDRGKEHRNATLLRDLFGEGAAPSGQTDQSSTGGRNDSDQSKHSTTLTGRQQQQPNKLSSPSPIRDSVVDDDIEELTL